jgi:hypothetical protein
VTLIESAISESGRTLILSLEEKGIIAFTTHGKECFKQLNSYGLDDLKPDDIKNQIENSGFYFKPYQGQSNYGISISSLFLFSDLRFFFF